MKVSRDFRIPQSVLKARQQGNQPLNLLDRASVVAFCRKNPLLAPLTSLIPFGLYERALFRTLEDIVFFPRKPISLIKPVSDEQIKEINRRAKLTADEIFSEAAQMPKGIQQDNVKARIWFIYDYYRGQLLIGETIEETLYRHAFNEFALINSLVRKESPSFDHLGIPSPANQKALIEAYDKLKLLITEKEKKFLQYFLLLHDIGKIDQGDNPSHEKRSAEMLDMIFRCSFEELSLNEKEVLKIIIERHSFIEKIVGNGNAQEEFKHFVKQPLLERAGLGQESFKGILQAWLLFRLVERAQSEVFGIIDEQFTQHLENIYETAFSL